jgi:cytochrome c-type biogenesis protein CcmH
MRVWALLASVFLLVAPAFAVEPGEALNDPALETRARAISAELRCLVCQNQSIDDSQAPLAKDLRLLVRERLVAGDTDDGVRSYLVTRYGDFVLLKPPFKIETLLLWISPFALLLLGGTAILIAARRRPRRVEAAQPELSRDERERLAALTDR